jgi:hypothetical protein
MINRDGFCHRYFTSLFPAERQRAGPDQGHHAEQLKRLFLDQALVAAAQSEPGLVGEESAWEAVPVLRCHPRTDRAKPQVLPGQRSTGGWLLNHRRA